MHDRSKRRTARALAGVLLGLLLFPLATFPAEAGSRPDAHAPIGVMGDHTHEAGEVMFSYRWMRMRMDGNRSRTSHDSIPSVIGTPQRPGRFLVVPTDMDMEMHMVGVMVAPHDRVTLVGMLPFVRLSMDHLRRDGRRFRTNNERIGDVRAGALLTLFEDETHHVHLNANVSIPTGSIRRKDTLPAPLNRGRLPYPMQIGSGTWDLLPGATYTGQVSWVSWGLQGIATVRTGRNSLGYRLGNRIDATAWAAVPWTDWVSTSARVGYSAFGNIVGEDDLLNPNLVPTADPNRRGGRRLELFAGVNLAIPLGPLGTHRLAVEGGFPAYEWLNGPQLETDWSITVGWQKAFHGLAAL